MAQTRIDEKGLAQRKTRIANIKSKISSVKDIGGLKGYPAWIPMKLILEQFINNQDRLIEAYLDTDNEKDSFIEARKARAVKLSMQAFYNFVEKNDDSVSGLQAELQKAEKEVEAIENGELI